MRVKWIEFENLETGLKIERINFNDDITLLVGISGAGKTQILNAVEYSLKLAVTKYIELQPYKVTICIEIDNNEYIWAYTIDKSKIEDIIVENKEKYEFCYEKLEKNGILIFERNRDNIRVIGYDKVPNPKRDESLISQYSEEDNFEKLIGGMRKLYSVEMEMEIRKGIKSENFIEMRNIVTHALNAKPDFRVFSHFPAIMKIYIAKRYYYEDVFMKIFDDTKELFMELDDIDVVEDPDREVFLLAIKVYGKTLMQYDISNGMLKSIYYIVELHTMSKDSVVLIDGFENGLGVNCIDVLAELLLTEREDLQFIITSHHPKIINGIDAPKWKIIDRDCEIIKNASTENYGIGNSKHDSYFNLINRWEFEGKI